MSAMLQLAVVVLSAAFLCWRRADMVRRNKQSWETLVARLKPNWDARELIDFPLPGDLSRPSLWKKLGRIHGSKGLRTIYKNAGVMLEMADYAAHNCATLDPSLLESLRSEAMQVRVQVLAALAKHAAYMAGESFSMNVLRAESAYAEMVLGITELLEVSAPDALPSFVSAA